MANDKDDEGRKQQGTARQHQDRTTGNEQPQGGQSSGIWPGPDVMLGAWTSWMGSGSAGAQPRADTGKPWWQLTPDDLAGEMLAGGIEQLHKTLAKDPMLARRPDVERQSAARSDPRRLGGGRAGAAQVWLRSLGGRDGHGLGRRTERDSGVRDRGLERRRAALVEVSPAAASDAGPSATSASPRRNGTATRSTGRSRKCICWPPTGCCGRAGGGRHGGGGAPAHRLPPPPVRRCDEPDPAAGFQSGGAAPGDGDGWRQLGGRRAQPAGRPEGRPAQHGGCDGLRAGAQSGRHAGQGGAAQPADRTDTVRANDGDSHRRRC